MDRNSVRKVGGIVLVVAGVGIGIWVSLILADVLTFLWIYSSSHKILEGYGTSEYFAKIVSVVFATFIMLIVHGTFWSMIKRDHKRWVPMVASGMLVWFVIMYVVSSPYAGSSFNPFSGEPQVMYYRDSNNLIVKMPKGAKTGPEGQSLQLIDQKTAEEYRKQLEATKEGADLIAATTFTVVARPGQPARISVPIGWRWDMVETIPAGWRTDNGYRDAHGNRIQVFEVVPPATEVTLKIRVARCVTIEGCAW